MRGAAPVAAAQSTSLLFSAFCCCPHATQRLDLLSISRLDFFLFPAVLGTESSALLPSSLVSAGEADGIILKVDGSGTVAWAVRFGSNKHDYSLGIVSGK